MKNIKNRFERGERLGKGEKLNFERLENKRIYNPSSPFKIGNNFYIVARVEDKSSGKSQSILFQEKNDKWFVVQSAPVFNLEDPFLTQLKDGILFGDVYVEWENREVKFLRTVFYYGKNFFSLDPEKPYFYGPAMMKDIRIVELENGFGIFTRPWGGKFLRGRICYFEIDDLEKLKDEKVFEKGKIIGLPLKDNEWVGSNEVYYLDKNNLGALGHFAYKDNDNNLHYLAMTFIFQPLSYQVKNFKIIAERKDFPEGPSKD
jgi:hypothetical protein